MTNSLNFLETKMNHIPMLYSDKIIEQSKKLNNPLVNNYMLFPEQPKNNMKMKPMKPNKPVSYDVIPLNEARYNSILPKEFQVMQIKSVPPFLPPGRIRMEGEEETGRMLGVEDRQGLFTYQPGDCVGEWGDWNDDNCSDNSEDRCALKYRKYKVTDQGRPNGRPCTYNGNIISDDELEYNFCMGNSNLDRCGVDNDNVCACKLDDVSQCYYNQEIYNRCNSYDDQENCDGDDDCNWLENDSTSIHHKKCKTKHSTDPSFFENYKGCLCSNVNKMVDTDGKCKDIYAAASSPQPEPPQVLSPTNQNFINEFKKSFDNFVQNPNDFTNEPKKDWINLIKDRNILLSILSKNDLNNINNNNNGINNNNNGSQDQPDTPSSREAQLAEMFLGHPRPPHPARRRATTRGPVSPPHVPPPASPGSIGLQPVMN
jgi:hypothetical protein